MASSPWNRGTYSMAIKVNLRSLGFSLLLLCLTISAAALAEDGAKQPERLPVTTSSAAAARYFENGMVNYEKHRWNLALRDWNEAIRLDPKFALAYTWVCMTTVDPAEESSNRAKAK